MKSTSICLRISADYNYFRGFQNKWKEVKYSIESSNINLKFKWKHNVY